MYHPAIMIAEKRRAQIIELVNLHGSVSIEELLELFKVSRMTIWRDLKELEIKGVIMRVHGGALKVDELDEKEEEFSLRRKEHLNEKRKIARFAAKNFVNDSDIIFLDGGSTVLEMIPHLKQSNLTILSNGLNTLLYASKFLPHLNVIGCGGILRKPSFTFVGHEAEEFFGRYKVNTAFISGTGVTIEDGIMDPHPLEMEVKNLDEGLKRAGELLDLPIKGLKYKILDKVLKTVDGEVEEYIKIEIRPKLVSGQTKIKVSDDKLSAYFSIVFPKTVDNEEVELDYLLELIKKEKIKNGLKLQKLENLVEKLKENYDALKDILIAEGKPPEKGKNSEILDSVFSNIHELIPVLLII